MELKAGLGLPTAITFILFSFRKWFTHTNLDIGLRVGEKQALSQKYFVMPFKNNIKYIAKIKGCDINFRPVLDHSILG